MKTRLLISLFLIGLVFFQLTDSCQAAFSYGYENPIGHSTLTGFLEGLLINIQNIVGWLAVIFIVIGGVLYMTAGGKDSQITLAKNTIISALIGFSLAVAGPSLLKEIKDLVLPGGPVASIAGANTISDILINILDFSLTLIAILALITLIYSGLSYLGANGDRSKIDNAKKIAVYSVIALSVAGGSLIVINFIINILST